MQKIVAGKQLWNYDNLEPTEKKMFSKACAERTWAMASIEVEAPEGTAKSRGRSVRSETRAFSARIFCSRREVIDDIHIKAELGRYRMRGMAMFKKIPSWDDLTFLPGTLTRFVIEGYREKCETKTVIGPRAKRPLVLDIPYTSPA